MFDTHRTRPLSTVLTAIMAAAALAALSLPVRTAGAGGLVPAGHEILVNETTEYNQVNASVAINQAGEWVVVWEDQALGDPGDTGGVSIMGRVFGSDGIPVTGEFRVNERSSPSYRPFMPEVAISDDGSFAVAWGAFGCTETSTEVVVRRFGPDGQPLGPETSVSDGGFNCMPSVSMSSSGRFVVAYEHTDTETMKVEVRCGIFGPDGERAGSTAGLPMFSACTKTFPDVAIDEDGRFTVAWVCGKDVERVRNIFAIRYGPGGSPISEPFRVNETEGINSFPAAAASPTGEFAVGWCAAGFNGNRAMYMRLYDSEGNAAGPEFIVNASHVNDVTVPSLGMDKDGGAYAAWQNHTPEGSLGIYGLTVDAGSSPADGEFTIADPAMTDSYWYVSPDIAVSTGGMAAVAWAASRGDRTGMDILAKRFYTGAPDPSMYTEAARLLAPGLPGR